MRVVSFVSFFLVIIGAINWLLVGLARFDLVRWLFGRNSLASRIIYGVVGVAGITQLADATLRMTQRKSQPVEG